MIVYNHLPGPDFLLSSKSLRPGRNQPGKYPALTGIFPF